MKTSIIKFISPTVLAFVSLASVSTGSAQSLTTYHDGDLLLGFRQAGATSDYLVDIGQASSLPTSGTITFSLGNIATDLSGAFGSTWYTSNTVKWSVFGDVTAGVTGFNTFTKMYVGSPSSTKFPSLSTGSAQTGDADIQTVYGNYTNQFSTANSSVGYLEPTSNGFAYATYQNGSNSPGNSFETWSNTESTVNSALYLESFTANSNDSVSSSGISVPGSFSMGSNGTVIYTAAVPEPSTYAMIGVGAGLLFMAARRKACQA